MINLSQSLNHARTQIYQKSSPHACQPGPVPAEHVLLAPPQPKAQHFLNLFDRSSQELVSPGRHRDTHVTYPKKTLDFPTGGQSTGKSS